MSKLIGIRCKDMRQRKESSGESRLFGGYQTYDLLVQAMERQRQKPFSERIRPCLEHADWWVVQAQACVKCEKAIWDVDMGGGRKEVGKVAGVSGRRVHVALQDSGEILSYVVGKGFE